MLAAQCARNAGFPALLQLYILLSVNSSPTSFFVKVPLATNYFASSEEFQLPSVPHFRSRYIDSVGLLLIGV